MAMTTVSPTEEDAAFGEISADPTSFGASDRVRTEWQNRVAAEYTSAAITQHLVLWLMKVGAPPDLLEAGLRIVSDELVHSRMAHEVYCAAQGSEPAAIDPQQLGLSATEAGLWSDILRCTLLNFCLNETVAVPLFHHLRAGCRQPLARSALDRVLRDEVRHRDFGWDLLDWLLISPVHEQVRATAPVLLPSMFAALACNYGLGNPAVAADAGDLTDDDRTWGLVPPRDYADILLRTFDRDWVPRFAARGIDIAPMRTMLTAPGGVGPG